MCGVFLSVSAFLLLRDFLLIIDTIPCSVLPGSCQITSETHYEESLSIQMASLPSGRTKPALLLPLFLVALLLVIL